MSPLEKIREDFPVLNQKIRGKPLVYLDNAATSQAPREVLDAMDRFYSENRSNVHRGVYHLSERATGAYEGSRKRIAKFLGAKSEREIVFTRGTTEGINLVAAGFSRKFLKPGDEVVISHMEHHSNIVPWQMACETSGAKLRVIPITDSGELRLDEFEKLLSDRTKIVSIVHVSNTLGTINPVEEIIRISHKRGIPVLLDGAQAAGHGRIDLTTLDADFYALSGHKMFGPTGIGVLYGKEKWLDDLPPYQGGGDMIRQVTFEKTTYNDLPYKFEAGTPHIAGALAGIDGLRIIGRAKKKVSIVSFVFEKIHPHDVATILDSEGIAIRAGHHCTQPLMERFGIPATSRASFAFYNTREEVEALAKGLKKVMGIFG